MKKVEEKLKPWRFGYADGEVGSRFRINEPIVYEEHLETN